MGKAFNTGEIEGLGGGDHGNSLEGSDKVVRGFVSGVDAARKDLHLGSLSITEFEKRIGDLENTWGSSLNGEEKAVLSLFSQLFGFANWARKVGPLDLAEREEKTNLIEESVLIQQEIVRTVTSNVNLKKLEFSKPLARYFVFLTDVFGDMLVEDHLDMKEYSRLVEGARGMVTTAFLFAKIGWEVSLPPTEYDMYYGVDLVVKNPETGKYFAVDVTSSGSKEHEELFFLKRTEPHKELKYSPSWNKVGFLRINIPPLRDIRGGMNDKAHDFYESKHGQWSRALGIPSKEAGKMFETKLQENV